MRAAGRIECAKDVLLERKVLVDRLDDHVGITERRKIARPYQPCACRSGSLGREFAPAHRPIECLGDPVLPGRERRGLRIDESHAEAASKTARGDARTHRAGAYDAHVLRRDRIGAHVP